MCYPLVPHSFRHTTTVALYFVLFVMSNHFHLPSTMFIEKELERNIVKTLTFFATRGIDL